jgi:hypothetical protein
VGLVPPSAHQVVQLGGQPAQQGQREEQLERRKEQQGERPEPVEEQLAERLVLRVHKPPSSNKWDFSNSRSARFRRRSPCCKLLSR